MFLGLCLFVNANRIATGTGATCPLAFFIPFLLFAFFPRIVSFRVVVLVSLPRNFTLLSIRRFSLRAFCSHGQRKMNGTHVLKFARR